MRTTSLDRRWLQATLESRPPYGAITAIPLAAGPSLSARRHNAGGATPEPYGGRGRRVGAALRPHRQAARPVLLQSSVRAAPSHALGVDLARDIVLAARDALPERSPCESRSNPHCGCPGRWSAAQRVFSNLLENAWQYSTHGRAFRVHARHGGLARDSSGVVDQGSRDHRTG